LSAQPANALSTATTVISAPLPAPPGPTTADMMNIMVMTMLQQQQALMTRSSIMAPQLPIIDHVPTTTSSAAMPSSSFPTGALTTMTSGISSSLLAFPDVSLADFCARYHVGEKDRARLETLEFHPGDNINDLEPEEWKDRAGFVPLSWSRIKTKNQQFLHDAEAGKWGQLKE
jgi:hypothetical protein